MADTDQNSTQGETVVDRLVFAALTEQRRARRWRVFFMLFFVVYLSVVTVMLMRAGDGASGVAGGSLLLIPLSCALFGISNDVALQVVPQIEIMFADLSEPNLFVKGDGYRSQYLLFPSLFR